MTGTQELPEERRYLDTTPQSRALWARAKELHPGGDTRSSVYWAPYPLFIQRGQGSRVWDADGVGRLDFVHNVTSVFAGHAHPAVTAALVKQGAQGTAFAGPTTVQLRLAEILCSRITSLELMRFTNSGTEATLNCLRAARVYTGRRIIAKVEGGYHGTHDLVAFSVRPSLESAGPASRPATVSEFPGTSPVQPDTVLVLPFNDVEASRALLRERAADLAAVIVEPCLGSAGIIPADREYLEMLRAETERIGAVLIFDEVVSFRVAPGGAQETYGVIPDMTALGKAIGGGLPVGAFGGKRDIMRLFDPSDGATIKHSGTFQANPMTAAAGVAALELMTRTTLSRMEALTKLLAAAVVKSCASAGVPVQVNTFGSLFGIHFTDRPVRNYRDVIAADPKLKRRVFLSMINEGVYVRPTLTGALCAVTDERDTERFATAFEAVIQRLVEPSERDAYVVGG